MLSKLYAFFLIYTTCDVFNSHLGFNFYASMWYTNLPFLFYISGTHGKIDLPGPLCYKTSYRFKCILYIRPNPTGSDKWVKHDGNGISTAAKLLFGAIK